MMSPLISDEKQTHLAHTILQFLQTNRDANLKGEPAIVLKEIKRVLNEEMKIEQEVTQSVRAKLESYSRNIPEGSQEWDVLYRKTYAEELRKRNLG
ncbi:MAG: hypothetical protein NPIRA02_12930 [Nitrospirales bacterium]|nr:MAG: hypothetical protein NPIRA02_12930 [Nitrospirales bacterium]